MPAPPVHISSLDNVADRVLDHLDRGHHTALVGRPGCGMTTFVSGLESVIAEEGFAIRRFDVASLGPTGLARELTFERPGDDTRQVVVLDHLARMRPDDCRRVLTSTTETAAQTGDLCLWCGNLDVRTLDRELGIKLCSVPSAHVSFPILSRDELLSAYRAIAVARGCRWGEAVLYLLLDLCGTDLSLVRSVTDYLPGDWSDRLYDESVWDRLQDWLKDDEAIDAYRTRLAVLPPSCAATLALIQFGGKPRCMRPELIEEVDDGLRRLCLEGFIIPNLLPGFYQLRNLALRCLLDDSVKPQLLFRRATNERAAALLQDAETMLRQVLSSVFARIGLEASRKRLVAMSQPGQVIDTELNRSLLKWAKETCSEDALKSLNSLFLESRGQFKKSHSVWETVLKMMRQDDVPDDESAHIQCIDYLTFDQLGQLVLGLLEQVFPHLTDPTAAKRVRESWLEGVAKVRRLRNQVAHLRNVGFQDMEDLAGTLGRLRQDVIDYGGWRDEQIAATEREETATVN